MRSPGNTDAELRERIALFFDAGAREVWICVDSGAMEFYLEASTGTAPASALFPTFPRKIDLR